MRTGGSTCRAHIADDLQALHFVSHFQAFGEPGQMRIACFDVAGMREPDEITGRSSEANERNLSERGRSHGGAHRRTEVDAFVVEDADACDGKWR